VTRWALVADDWAERLARAGLRDLRDLLDQPPTELHLEGRWRALTKPGLGGRERWRWELPGPPAQVVYLKRYTHTPAREQLDRIRRQTIWHSRAWWEFRQSAALARQYVPVVRAIGVAEEMQAPFEVRSAVLFEEVPGDAFDRTWLRFCAARAPLTTGLARFDLTRRLACFASAFHQTGACHRDLYLCHVFADLDPDGGRAPEFTLIDLARTHRPRLRRARWILKDLSQLDASAQQIGATRTDRMRFLLTYLGLLTGAPRARWYARRIVEKSDRILRRIARKSGPAPQLSGAPVTDPAR
jgi:heptose I phosphotransferase